ncbi:MAG: 3-deoxy-8-phosphooctulonate synthase, partial [Gammaproteobacteria bacterium]|nr:3-deoxy-8-phosphooctulonate synthase [Gammaproteobacteria bacterium]
MELCGFDVGIEQPLFLIAGPCVIESEELVMETATELKQICDRLDMP